MFAKKLFSYFLISFIITSFVGFDGFRNPAQAATSPVKISGQKGLFDKVNQSIKLSWVFTTSSGDQVINGIGLELSMIIKNKKDNEETKINVSKFEPEPEAWKKNGDAMGYVKETGFVPASINRFMKTLSPKYNGKTYLYDGKITGGLWNTNVPMAAFGPQDLKKSNVTIDFIDTLTPKAIATDSDFLVRYTIIPIVGVNNVKTGELNQVYRQSPFSIEVDLSKPTGVIEPPRDYQWYEQNYFPDGGTFKIAINCDGVAPNGKPPTITIAGKEGEINGRNWKRPSRTFTLKYVALARGSESDRNKFYFIAPSPDDKLAFSITDEASGYFGPSTRKLSPEVKLVHVMDLENPNDDIPSSSILSTKTSLGGVNLDFDINSFSRCVTNRYYNESTTSDCGQGGTYGKENYKPGEAPLSRCISAEALSKDAIGHKFKTGEGVTDTNPSSGGDTECTNAFKLGYIAKYLIGGAICGTMEFLSAIAVSFANFALNIMIYASGLQ